MRTVVSEEFQQRWAQYYAAWVEGDRTRRPIMTWEQITLPSGEIQVTCTGLEFSSLDGVHDRIDHFGT
jgi:hypothetical protein